MITLTGGLASMAVRSRLLADVASSAFAAPPWNETPAHARQLADRMPADARHPGFALALAFTHRGASLAGFGYGLPSARQHRRKPPLCRHRAVRVLRACRRVSPGN